MIDFILLFLLIFSNGQRSRQIALYINISASVLSETAIEVLIDGTQDRANFLIGLKNVKIMVQVLEGS